jgi:hypothetical protein
MTRCMARQMKRRHFIHTIAATSLLAVEAPRKAPFRVIYSNDLTNITSRVADSGLKAPGR